MTQATRRTVTHFEHVFHIQHMCLEEVVQGSVFVILCDQEQLSPGSSSFDVRSNVTCGAKKMGFINLNEKDENNEQFSHENSCKEKVYKAQSD